MIYYSDLIDKPFCEYGDGPDCYNCWGLVKEVYRRFNMPLPDIKSISSTLCVEINNIVNEQKNSPSWEMLKKPEVPCVVTLRGNYSDKVNHLGVYIGYGKFLHTSIGHVSVGRLICPRWKQRIEGFARYVGE